MQKIDRSPECLLRQKVYSWKKFITEKIIPFAYQFEIIQDDGTVNVFCIPGGYVYTGLLKFVDNEAICAGVLAHEIAHAERRHSINKMTTQTGLETVIGLASGKIGESETQVAGAIAGLGLMKFSRTEKEEADTYSFKHLISIKYYPGAIRFSFEKIGVNQKGGMFGRLLSTHSLPKDRFDNVNKLILEAGSRQSNEANLLTEPYQKFKRS